MGTMNINQSVDIRLTKKTIEWLVNHTLPQDAEIIEASSEEMRRASLQQAPQGITGIFHQPRHETDLTTPEHELCLALDNVQDPGNLGTIIRIADWFGIEEIFCSIGSADVYNPKTIQATMGAIARVKVHYVDLPGFIASLGDSTPVYGTFLNGDDIYNNELTSNGLIVMGNEGNGISDKCASLISRRILIPNYPQGRITDHRINYTIYNLSAFMDGQIQDCIDHLIVAENAERMKESEL